MNRLDERYQKIYIPALALNLNTYLIQHQALDPLLEIPLETPPDPRVHPIDGLLMPDGSSFYKFYFDYMVHKALLSDGELLMLEQLLNEEPDLAVILFKLLVGVADNTVVSGYISNGFRDEEGIDYINEPNDEHLCSMQDGCFVVTAKATAQLGRDFLESMVREAEKEADDGSKLKNIG